MAVVNGDPNAPIDLLPYLSGKLVEVTLPEGIKPIIFQTRVLELSGVENLPGTVVHVRWCLFGNYWVDTYYYYTGTTWETREGDKIYFSRKCNKDMLWQHSINFAALRGAQQ